MQNYFEINKKRLQLIKTCEVVAVEVVLTEKIKVLNTYIRKEEPKFSVSTLGNQKNKSKFNPILTK